MTRDEINKITKCAVIKYDNNNPAFIVFKVMIGQISKVKKSLNCDYIGNGYFKIKH